MALLRPSHTFASVAQELVDGLENGSIFLREPDRSEAALAANGADGVGANDPQVQSVLRECVRTLERIASYEMPPDLEQRLRLLGENKEFLAGPAHDDLAALVDLAKQRTIEKLEASLALRKLRAVLHDTVVQ